MINGFFFNTPIDKNWLGFIFAEVYKDRIYAPFVEGKKDLTILDLGGNIGITAYYFSQFAKQVYVLEPAVEHFAMLAKMVEFNQLANVKAIPKAIWIENTKLPFYHNDNRTMFSLHKAVDDGKTPPETVETITLDSLFESEKIEHVDLLKADIEGNEYELFASEGFRKIAPKVDTVIAEVHQWANRHPNQIKDALKSNGFEVSFMPSSAEIIVGRRK